MDESLSPPIVVLRYLLSYQQNRNAYVVITKIQMPKSGLVKRFYLSGQEKEYTIIRYICYTMAYRIGTTLSDWTIEIPTAVKKKIRQLPPACVKSLELLLLEIRKEGPFRANWPHYGPLKKEKKMIPDRAFHCHVASGKPTYVACWSIVDKKIKIVEIFYVGTHENAPY